MGSGNDIVDIDLGGDATFYLGSGHDRISLANAGNNVVYGGSGRDYVNGNFGNSVIRTESGEDQIDVGRDSANNVLDGGPNRDLARLELTTTATTCTRIERITDFEGNARTCP